MLNGTFSVIFKHCDCEGTLGIDDLCRMSLEKPADPKCEAITYSEGSVLWSFGVIIMKNECLVFQNMQISLVDQ